MLMRQAVAQLEYYTGTALDDQGYDNHVAFDQDKYSILTPKNYSLFSFTPKAGNQLTYPHDIGWSIASAATIVESIYRGSFDKSSTARRFKSPSFIHMLYADEIKVCESPVSLAQTINKLQGIGIPALSEYASFCPTSTNQQVIEKARSLPQFAFVKTFERTMDHGEIVSRIKVMLALDRPVIASFHCPPSFVTAKEFWSPKERMSDEFPLHTVTVIGYDDELYGGAFQIANSWGSTWGNSGYMWIRYQDIEFFRYGYAVTYKENEGDNLSVLDGDLVLNNLEISKIINFHRFNPKGYYLINIPSKELSFNLSGRATKPFYVKIYYKGADGVQQIYPMEKWISSLLEYSYSDFEIPGDGNSYDVYDENISMMYIFMSLADIDEFDFSKVVESYDDISQLLTSRDFDFSRQVVWFDDTPKFSARLFQGEIVPLILELSFDKK
jgi:hypothetical protein